jgi:hypothetical protein
MYRSSQKNRRNEGGSKGFPVPFLPVRMTAPPRPRREHRCPVLPVGYFGHDLRPQHHHLAPGSSWMNLSARERDGSWCIRPEYQNRAFSAPDFWIVRNSWCREEHIRAVGPGDDEIEFSADMPAISRASRPPGWPDPEWPRRAPQSSVPDSGRGGDPLIGRIHHLLNPHSSELWEEQ